MARKIRRVIREKEIKNQNKGASPSPAPYEVDMTESATRVYSDLYERSRKAEAQGDPTNSVCTTFRMVQEAIKAIIPRDPINRKHALSGDLSNRFRLQKGRLRICWIASSTSRRIRILFISETLRKQGDMNDPYRLFTKMLMSGEFDTIFSRLGVKKPLSRSATIQ